jgi:hypothetical protein
MTGVMVGGRYLLGCTFSSSCMMRNKQPPHAEKANIRVAWIRTWTRTTRCFADAYQTQRSSKVFLSLLATYRRYATCRLMKATLQRLGQSKD